MADRPAEGRIQGGVVLLAQGVGLVVTAPPAGGRGHGGAWPTARRRARRSRRSSSKVSTTSACSGVGMVVACGMPARRRASESGRELGAGPGQHGDPAVIGGERRQRGRQGVLRGRSAERPRPQDGPGCGAGPGGRSAQAFRHPFDVRRDESVRRDHHPGRTSVVRFEDDAPGVRVADRELENAPHVGQAPGVDRLVVVTHHEQVALRLRQQPDELHLGRVDVLELVHEHVVVARLPARADRVIGPESCQGHGQETVEVDQPAELEQRPVPLDHGLDGGRMPTVLEDGQRHGRVELFGGWHDDLWSKRGDDLAPCMPDQREAVGHQSSGDARIEHDLSGEGMEGPNLGPAGTRDDAETRLDPRGQLRGRVAVERHDQDPVGRHARRDEDPDPRHQRRRLAASRGRDDLRRPRAQGRRRSLLLVEAREKRVYRRSHLTEPGRGRLLRAHLGIPAILRGARTAGEPEQDVISE